MKHNIHWSEYSFIINTLSLNVIVFFNPLFKKCVSTISFYTEKKPRLIKLAFLRKLSYWDIF